MAAEPAKTRKPRKPSVPRPLYVLYSGTDVEIHGASRNAAEILSKIDEAMEKGETLRYKKVTA